MKTEVKTNSGWATAGKVWVSLLIVGAIMFAIAVRRGETHYFDDM